MKESATKTRRKKEVTIKELSLNYPVKMAGIATAASMNRSLLYSYKSGEKVPSRDQLDRVEVAIHELGKQLQNLKLVNRYVEEDEEMA